MERIKRALELAKAERDQALRQQGVAPAAAGASAADGAAVALPAAPVAANEPAPVSEPVAVPEPGLAAVPRTRSVAPDVEAMRAGNLLMPGLAGHLAHSFKMLRTQVVQRLKQRGWNTIAVMSPAPDEGKTFTAINLAIAIAADRDTRALLVDLDLRAPRLHRRFGFVPQVGVEDCLAGEAALADALVSPEGYPGLLVLPARQAVEHSSELLASTRARAMFSEIKSRYANRYVIYDLPPVLGSDDALAFAPLVDAALVVIGENRTKREELLRCFELMREIPVVGTVLNGSRHERSAAYAY